MSDNKLLDAQRELLSYSYNAAATYTNVVLGLGYAEYFGLLMITKEYLAQSQILFSALLISISLLTFIIFEVYKSYYTSQRLIGLYEVVSDEQNFCQAYLKWKSDNHDRTNGHIKIWRNVFFFSVFTGILGAIILIVALIINI